MCLILKLYEISGSVFPPWQSVTASAVTPVQGRTCLSGPSFTKLSFLRRDQLIWEWPWLKRVREKEHQFLCYTITSGGAKACQLELTSDPGIAVDRSNVSIQTRAKGHYLELRCTSVQPGGPQVPGGLWRGHTPPLGHHTAPESRGDRHLAAGWSHSPRARPAPLTHVKCSQHTQHSIHAVLPFVNLVKKKLVWKK